MRNLIAFISKYSYFFLFLIFEVFAFYLLFSNNHLQRTSFLNSTNSITGSIYQRYANFTDYLNLKEVNQLLVEENKRLKENQIQSYQRLFGENVMVDDTIFKQKYFYTIAGVINNSVNKQSNYLTINIGENNGIKNGMGVVSSNGVVGVVKNVSKNYASILSLLHQDAKISAKLKNTNYFGSMQWDGVDYRMGVLEDIPNHVDIQVGDTIETSGYSAIFPEGIPLAIVSEFEKVEGENFYEIKVQFTNDFKTLSKVYVVKNIHQEEQNLLEEEEVVKND
tara:strand:- start:1758 stop:2594 length:837 start_codon:yes stop_codon:yes gene_type:complete